MPIRLDPLLVRALARGLEADFRGARVRAVEFDHAARTARLYTDRGVLGFSVGGTVSISVDDPAEPPEQARRMPLRIASVEAVPERALVMALPRIRGLKKTFEWIVELRPAESNVALAEGDDRIIRHVLEAREAHGRRWRTGHRYPTPEGPPRRGLEDDLGPDGWMELLAGVPPAGRERALLTGIAFTSPLNVAWILGDAAESTDPALLREAFARWRELANLAGAECVWLPSPSGPQPYPHPLGRTDLPPVESLTDVLSGGEEEGASDARPEALRRLDELLSQAVRRVGSLQRQLETSADPGALRSTGDLLLARLAEVERGKETVVLEDFDGSAREIALDPLRSPQDNAADYYERATKAERARARIPELIDEAEAEVARLTALREGAAEGTVSRDDLETMLPARKTKGATVTGPSLPYRSFWSSGGIEIRVGRGSKHNDDLTFRHARPDDVWLHARHAAGAHVVLRWASDEAPPARDLEEAAVLAALHSKARTSGSVPVDWTRRKYVRKPRGAKAGSVTLARAQTLFVDPDPSLPEQLDTHPPAGR